ncbi:RTA1 like protein [Xylogone sp. PMI_703]|nr:RTA1 like protein [Xylogone sp. PMI_703]
MMYPRYEHSGYVDPNFPNPHGPHDASIIIYGYVPNITLCILGIVLFTLATIAHGTQVLLYRSWHFLPLTIACLMEVVGYVFRTLSSRDDPYNIIYFVVAYFLIVVAPVFISATLYICLTNLVTWAEDEGVKFNTELLSRKFILWTFVSADVICTLVQVVGASLIGNKTSNHEDPTAPNDILLAGLAIQTFFFSVYLLLLGNFVIKVSNDPRLARPLQARWFFIRALGISSLLVFVRTIFRLIETSQGVFGYLSSHEAFFGTLEFLPMIFAVAILAIWHPARYLQVPSATNKVQSYRLSDRTINV